MSRSFAKATGLDVPHTEASFFEHTLDDAGIENSYLTKHAQPANLAVELLDALLPPCDKKRVFLLSHGFTPLRESS